MCKNFMYFFQMGVCFMAGNLAGCSMMKTTGRWPGIPSDFNPDAGGEKKSS